MIKEERRKKKKRKNILQGILGILRNTKKASRPYRGFMPLEAAESSAGDLAAAFRSWGSCRRRRMI